MLVLALTIAMEGLCYSFAREPGSGWMLCRTSVSQSVKLESFSSFQFCLEFLSSDSPLVQTEPQLWLGPRDRYQMALFSLSFALSSSS